MDFLCLALFAAAAYCIVQIIRLIFADCDLTLQWAAKFGKNPAVLKGKVVWITGASSGIGEALAYELASVGCRLILSARREAELDRVKKQCLVSGPISKEDVLVLPLDMIETDSHIPAVEKVLQHFKQIDILVNNAGRSQRAVWEKIDIAVDRECLATNVLGGLSLTRGVLPHMYERKEGHIVVTSSMAGKFGAPLSASYTGSKHALHGYYESLRVEGSEYNVDVSIICPGPVFSNVLEIAFTGQKGELLHGKMKPEDKRMPTSRCAALCAVTIANKLDEAWISFHPILFFAYITQYCPTIARRLAVKLGLKQAKKIREGQ